jgi:hypothetical protein
MSSHIGTRQLYPVKGGYYVPAETFVLLQEYDEIHWPDIISIIASFTDGYKTRAGLTKEEAANLLEKFPKKEKTQLEVDEKMQMILLALIERSPRRVWEIAEIVEPPLQRGRRIIPSPRLRSSIKKMNGTLVMSTKSEVEITQTGVKVLTELVGVDRVEEAKRVGEVAKVAREKDLQMRREQHLTYGML